MRLRAVLGKTCIDNSFRLFRIDQTAALSNRQSWSGVAAVEKDPDEDRKAPRVR